VRTLPSAPSALQAGTRRAASHHFDNGLKYRDGAHEGNERFTPPEIMEPVRRALGGVVDLDPCTHISNPTAARRIFALPADGLALPWIAGTVYVNPPFGVAKDPWVRRCMQAARAGSAVVLLVPAATETQIVQEAMASASACVFITSRVHFGLLVDGEIVFGIKRHNGRQSAASHGSVLIGWNVDLHPCARLGQLMVPVRTDWDEPGAEVIAFPTAPGVKDAG
jgi:DNA N-6-adenine-methyltransferase (Dam)